MLYFDRTWRRRCRWSDQSGYGGHTYPAAQSRIQSRGLPVGVVTRFISLIAVLTVAAATTVSSLSVRFFGSGGIVSVTHEESSIVLFDNREITVDIDTVFEDSPN